ncbi:hypothetical protein ACFQU2_08080 [Siccirubricoccus deserti]
MQRRTLLAAASLLPTTALAQGTAQGTDWPIGRFASSSPSRPAAPTTSSPGSMPRR